MTTIILLNGEKQVGKSRFARELASQIDFHVGGVDTVGRFSLVGPLEQMMLALSSYVLGKELSYEDFKKAEIAGRLGRDWLIAFGNTARQVDEDALVRMLFDHIQSHYTKKMVDYIIIENWGFASELHSFQYWAPVYAPGAQLLSIHLNARSTREYKPDEQFDGDNRFNLPHLADLINPSVTEVLKHLLPDAEWNPGTDDSVDSFSPEFLRAGNARIYQEIERITDKVADLTTSD